MDASEERQPHKPLLEVSADEAGQKLFQFLIRRTGLPGGAVMKLVRTGQVRVDGKRSKPYDRLAQGSMVRIPPRLAEELQNASAQAPDTADTAAAPDSVGASHSPPLVIIAEGDGILAIDKPAGLPTHGGTGHTDSIASRLSAMLPEATFAPTPAHRLDKDTSGILLAATSYTALTALQQTFQTRTVEKHYLAWVSGKFPSGGPYSLEDSLAKSGRPGSQKMHTDASDGKRAVSHVRLVRSTKNASLVEVRLLTGRTHQIRLQLASRGFPLIGDVKYGGPGGSPLLLHAWRIALPEDVLPGHDAQEYVSLPCWPEPYAVTSRHDEWPRTPTAPWSF